MIDLTTLSPTEREQIPKMPALLLDKRRATMALSISEPQLDLMVKAGELPTIHVGRRVLFDPMDLRRWIRSEKTNPLTSAAKIGADPPGPDDGENVSSG